MAVLTAQWAALFNMSKYLKRACNVTSEEGVHTRGREMSAHHIEQCNALFLARDYTCRLNIPDANDKDYSGSTHQERPG